MTQLNIYDSILNIVFLQLQTLPPQVPFTLQAQPNRPNTPFVLGTKPAQTFTHIIYHTTKIYKCILIARHVLLCIRPTEFILQRSNNKDLVIPTECIGRMNYIICSGMNTASIVNSFNVQSSSLALAGFRYLLQSSYEMVPWEEFVLFGFGNSTMN